MRAATGARTLQRQGSCRLSDIQPADSRESNKAMLPARSSLSLLRRAGLARRLSLRATGAEYHERVKGDAETPGRFMKALSVPNIGAEVTRDPLYNKGSAFSTGERDRLGIRGLVHPKITPMELQYTTTGVRHQRPTRTTVSRRPARCATASRA